MDTEKVFRTKTGYCHILEDRIELTRDGVAGSQAKVVTGNTIAWLLIIYGIIAFVFLLLALKGFNQGEDIIGSVFMVLGGALAVQIIRSLNYSATPVVYRKDITEVRFKESIPGQTRSYFKVYFQNEKGQIKQRLIMLPGSLNNGKIETQKALEIMNAEFRNIKRYY